MPRPPPPVNGNVSYPSGVFNQESVLLYSLAPHPSSSAFLFRLLGNFLLLSCPSPLCRLHSSLSLSFIHSLLIHSVSASCFGFFVEVEKCVFFQAIVLSYYTAQSQFLTVYKIFSCSPIVLFKQINNNKTIKCLCYTVILKEVQTSIPKIDLHSFF